MLRIVCVWDFPPLEGGRRKIEILHSKHEIVAHHTWTLCSVLLTTYTFSELNVLECLQNPNTKISASKTFLLTILRDFQRHKSAHSEQRIWKTSLILRRKFLLCSACADFRRQSGGKHSRGNIKFNYFNVVEYPKTQIIKNFSPPTSLWSAMKRREHAAEDFKSFIQSQFRNAVGDFFYPKMKSNKCIHLHNKYFRIDCFTTQYAVVDDVTSS